MKIQPQKVQIETLSLDPKNPRSITKEKFQELKQSIKDFPEMELVKPLTIADGFVIGGNMRLLAMKDLGYREVLVNDVTEWTQAQRDEFMIKDNTHYGAWDYDILANEWDVHPLNDWGLDLWEPEVEELKGLTDEDEVPEAPQEPITKLGDVWILGEHRVMCGDSTSKEAVEILMDGNRTNTMVTDPPYGVELDQSWRDKALGSKALGKGNSNLVHNDNKSDWTAVWKLFKGNVAYVWHASSFTDVVMNSLRNANLEPSQQIIWNKSVMVMGRSDYHFKHEPCWYAVRKGKNHSWMGDRKQTTIWDAAPPNHIMGGSKEEKTSHPTQKPALLYERAYLNHTNREEYVYEPFGGSGTSVIVCEKIGRKSLTMELDPKYCDVIVKRWEDFTGKKAHLEEDEFKIITQAH